MLDPYANPQEPASAGFLMPEESADVPEEQEKFGTAKTKLVKMSAEINLAEGIEQLELDKIGRRVCEDFEIDEQSRKEWLDKNKEAIKLANQIREEKTFPWPGAAQVKLPLIADAAIKFAARAYSEIIRDGQVVKGQVVGPDPDGQKQQRSVRVGQFMSWQLTQNMEEWEDDTDKLLHVLPVVGHVFRKLYYDPSRRRAISQLVMPENLCVNYTAPNLESARRITHILKNVSQNTVIENRRCGAWLDIDFTKDIEAVATEKEPEDSKYWDFLEQHKWLDLDKDGYEEPYIVTVEKNSQKVVRIAARFEEDDILENAKGQIARITPCMYFADYKFIPSFDGSYYYVGFGVLLAPLNETGNTIFNQLLDAGTMATTGGGFLSKEIKIRSGIYRFAPNEWKKTEATAEQQSKGITPLPVREPSPVLFQLLSLVMELSKDLASVKDVLIGDTPGANTSPTTVLAMIEQGMKTFNAIYKRVYRSLKNEFGILFRINGQYLDEEEYYKVLDQDAKVYRDDFNREDCDIVPVADPSVASDMQRMARAQAMREMIGAPGVNPQPIIKYALESMHLDSKLIEEILTPPPSSPPPEVLQMQHETEMKAADVHLKEQELNIRGGELNLKVQQAAYTADLQQAMTEKTLAEANIVPVKQQNEALRTLVESEHRSIEHDFSLASHQLAVANAIDTSNQTQQQLDQQAQQPASDTQQ